MAMDGLPGMLVWRRGTGARGWPTPRGSASSASTLAGTGARIEWQPRYVDDLVATAHANTTVVRRALPTQRVPSVAIRRL